LVPRGYTRCSSDRCTTPDPSAGNSSRTTDKRARGCRGPGDVLWAFTGEALGRKINSVLAFVAAAKRTAKPTEPSREDVAVALPGVDQIVEAVAIEVGNNEVPAGSAFLIEVADPLFLEARRPSLVAERGGGLADVSAIALAD